jgi:hypothetical protein
MLDDAGTTKTWNGVYYAPGHCSSYGLNCASRRCASPGHYTAKMCGCVSIDQNGFCAGSTCVSVPFDYPTANTVVGTLPGGDH